VQPGVDTVLEVDTPEHLAFKTRIGGPGRRMFAWVIDFFVRAAIWVAILIIVSLIFGSVDLGGVAQAVIFVSMFVIDWFYFVVCEILSGGRSPGKMVMKLRVVRPNGLPVTWVQSILRNFLRAADLALFPPYYLMLGPMIMVFDPKFRRLGDFVAGTIVVIEESTAVASRHAVPPDPELVAELPATLPLDRGDLEALELFVNREHMSDARREELAEIVAPLYAHKLSMPRPKNATAFLASLWARAQDPKRKMMVES
jgi:uncharacterized RDD family membrane protein YckC